MRYSCAPRLVGIAFQVLEICSFCFRLNFHPWGQKIELAEKFMQVWVDVKMHTHQFLVGMVSLVLEIKLAFEFVQISLSDHGL